MNRIYYLSLGCPKNRVDTEHALGSLSGLCPVLTVENPEDADCIFIHTCGLIAPGIEESVRTLMETIAVVSDLPAASRPLLVVAGCLVGRYGKETLAPDLPEVDLFIDNRELATWGLQLCSALSTRNVTKKSTLDGSGILEPAAGNAAALPRLLSTGPSYAWLKISYG